MDSFESFRQELASRGLLVPMEADGLYARSATYERVLSRLEDLITQRGLSDQPEILRFPPVMNQRHFERSGYMGNFPQLAGLVHAFCGDDRDHQLLLDKIESGDDWSRGEPSAGCVLVPAACYPLYPLVAARGPVKANGSVFDVQAYCFRHEPSPDPARMQSFRMRESVRIGTPDQVQEFRAQWIARCKAMVSELDVPCDVVPANDPFFGRLGKLVKNNQREQGLKFELVIPIAGDAPTACASFNYHQDYFATIWNIQSENGGPVHTSCVGFGLERLVLAVFRQHGLEPPAWPENVRRLLWSS